jgi:protease I
MSGDAGEAQEIYYAKYRLEEEGWQVDIAALQKRPFLSVVHDFDPGFDTYTEKPGYTWDADLAFAEVDPAAYVALVVPGGRAPEYIRNDADCARIVAHFFAADKPVAQLCHAALIFTAAGVLNGRRTAAYPALKPAVTAAGAEFVDGAAVVDGMMVSARAWPDHPEWMREFIQVLRAKSPSV